MQIAVSRYTANIPNAAPGIKLYMNIVYNLFVFIYYLSIRLDTTTQGRGISHSISHQRKRTQNNTKIVLERGTKVPLPPSYLAGGLDDGERKVQRG